METLGERLKRLRNLNEKSTIQIATKLEVSPSTYREWEYGRQIKGEPYLKMAEVFGVSLHYILTGKETNLDLQLADIEKAVKIIRLSL